MLQHLKKEVIQAKDSEEGVIAGQVIHDNHSTDEEKSIVYEACITWSHLPTI